MRTKNKHARRVAVAYGRLGDAFRIAEEITMRIAHGFDFDKPVRIQRLRLLVALNEIDERFEAARKLAEDLADPEARRP